MTVSLTRWSSSRKASSAAAAASSPHASRSASRSAAARAVPSSVRRWAPATVVVSPSIAELVEDRLDVGRCREDGVGDGLGRREALDRDRPQALVGRHLPGRRAAPAEGSALAPSGAAAGSPISMPSSRAHAEQRPRLGHDLGRARDRALEDLAGPAVDRDDRPGLEGPLAEDDPPSSTCIARRPDHRGDPPAARDDRGVARETAARRQDPGRAGHPVDVVGRGLGTDQDRGLAGLGGGLGRLGARDDRPGRHPRRGRQAGDERQHQAAPGARGGRRIGEQRRAPAPRPPPSSSGNDSSSAMSTAIRSAACGLRLPTRTWSIQSRPSSIVNSMSHRSA